VWRQVKAIVRTTGLIALFVLVLAAPGRTQTAAAGTGVLVFAASSLQTVLDALAPLVERDAGVRVRFSYAASSALARQIESGAPADVFISADLDWMNYVAERALIRIDTRVILAANQLVLIAPAGRAPVLKIARGFPLRAALGQHRLALADPSSVPAGKYAQAALTRLGVWPDVGPRVAAAENVRAALLLVSRGEAPLGIVYRTDALADRRVVVVDTFPADTHQPIVYPAAVISNGSPDAVRVLDSLQSSAAQAVLAAHGFLISGSVRAR
jgi:molybdate transport system substrate-binding protein